MNRGPADGRQPPGTAGDTTPDRWQQEAGFSVFFDLQPGEPGGPERRTRLYHEETGDETTVRGWEPAGWVRWMLGRLRSAPPPSEAAGAAASVVSVEITDVRLAGDPASAAGGDTVAVEVRVRVTGLAELHRMLGARVAGVLFGPGPR